MCMMQAPINRNIPTVKRRDHEKKEKTPYNKEARMKPDPSFIDERKKEKEPEKDFFDKILEMF